MQTIHPVVLYGCTAWDRRLLPVDEFEERLRSVRREMKVNGLNGLIVYGDSRNYAKLCYLTNYIPKLGWAAVFIPSAGKPFLLAGVLGVRELPDVEIMTWLNDVRLAKNMEEQVSEFAAGLHGSAVGAAVSVGICGEAHMNDSLFDKMMLGCRNGKVSNADEWMDRAVYRQRPRELAVIRKACEMLASSFRVLNREQGKGSGVISALAEAEREARALGAHDVRVMFSLDQGETLQPYENLSAETNDPLVAYLAVEYLGYWAEGMITVTSKMYPSYQRAADVLAEFSAFMKPGVEIRSIVKELEARTAPFIFHPALNGSWGCRLGLALNDHELNASNQETLEKDQIYSLQVGLSDEENGEHVLLSQIVYVHDHGIETLGSALDTEGSL